MLWLARVLGFLLFGPRVYRLRDSVRYHVADNCDGQGLKGFLRGLITSQIDTAPKPCRLHIRKRHGLITSQIDTAPKLEHVFVKLADGLITSQIDTAPKLSAVAARPPASLITSQIDTAPKPAGLAI